VPTNTLTIQTKPAITKNFNLNTKFIKDYNSGQAGSAITEKGGIISRNIKKLIPSDGYYNAQLSLKFTKLADQMAYSSEKNIAYTAEDMAISLLSDGMDTWYGITGSFAGCGTDNPNLAQMCDGRFGGWMAFGWEDLKYWGTDKISIDGSRKFASLMTLKP